MSDFLSRFQEVYGNLSRSEAPEADLLLLDLPPEAAHLLRLCAIPHTFDAVVLRLLDPALQPEGSEEALNEFRELPAVLQLHDCLALHDVVRRQLFLQWLTGANKKEFSAVSSRLAEFFRPQETGTATAVTRQHSYLFHRLGANLDEGFIEFQRIYQERRDQSRFAECEALVRLIREYETVLDPHQRAWMGYYEAEILDDNRDWTRAVQRLDLMLRDNLPDDVRSMALLRLGSALRKIKRLDEAEFRCRECLELSARIQKGGAPLRLIYHELGIVARDRGDFGEARTQLESALRIAKADGDRIDVALAYNSLGTLLLRPMPADAVAALEECLKLLDRERDAVRVAQVLNNLAQSYANLGKWTQSEFTYRHSLEIKRATGDVYGLASTLLNVSRVYRAQQNFAEARSALLESSALFERVKDLTLSGKAYRELARLADSENHRAEADLHARRAVQLFDQASNKEDAEATRREFRIDQAKPSRWLIWIIIALVAAISLFIIDELV